MPNPHQEEYDATVSAYADRIHRAATIEDAKRIKAEADAEGIDFGHIEQEVGVDLRILRDDFYS